MDFLNDIITKKKFLNRMFAFFAFFSVLIIFLRTLSYLEERLTSFVVSLALFYLLGFYLLKIVANKEKKLLLISIFSSLFVVELVLFFVSPLKSADEKQGDFNYQSPYYVHQMSHFKEAHKEYTYVELEFTNKFTTNSLGLRDDEASKDAEIFIIGDSFIEGYGVQNNYTIDKRLENLIGCESCVLNVGCKGSDVLVGYYALEKLIELDLKPKLVLLNINNTDLYDMNKHFKVEVQPSKLFEFIYGSSFIFRHFAHIFFDLDFLLLNKEDRAKYDEIVLKEIEKVLLKYNEYLEGKNIPFVVFLQPLLSELSNGNFTLENLELLKKKNIVVYNLLPDFKQYSNYKSLFWPIDRHFNEKGVDVYSKLIFEKANLSEFIE